jgi:hypothetical protein
LKTDLKTQDANLKTIINQFDQKVRQAFEKENINLNPNKKVSIAGTSG